MAERLNRTITEAYEIPEWEFALWYAHWELCKEENG